MAEAKESTMGTQNSSTDTTDQLPPGMSTEPNYYDTLVPRVTRTDPVIQARKSTYKKPRKNIDRSGLGGRSTAEKLGWRYVDAARDNYAVSTIENLKSRYTKMGADMDYLYKQGRIKTVNPAKQDVDDILEYFKYRKDTGVSKSELQHTKAAMSNLYHFANNPNYDIADRTCPEFRVQREEKRYDSLSPALCEKIFATAMALDKNNWFKMVRYATVIIAICTGTRAKELRLADVNAISVSNGIWSMTIKHPKGEGKYSKPRTVAIDPEGIPFIHKYILARAEHIRELGFETQALIPGAKVTDGHLQENTVRYYAEYVSHEMNNDMIDLRTCRRTFGQRLIDRGADINSVSKAMGHTNTVTTERYYCSMTEMQAFDKTVEVYRSKPKLSSIEHSQLPIGLDPTGDTPQ